MESADWVHDPNLIEVVRDVATKMDSLTGDVIVAAIDRLRSDNRLFAMVLRGSVFDPIEIEEAIQRALGPKERQSP